MFTHYFSSSFFFILEMTLHHSVCSSKTILPCFFRKKIVTTPLNICHKTIIVNHPLPPHDGVLSCHIFIFKYYCHSLNAFGCCAVKNSLAIILKKSSIHIIKFHTNFRQTLSYPFKDMLNLILGSW